MFHSLLAACRRWLLAWAGIAVAAIACDRASAGDRFWPWKLSEDGRREWPVGLVVAPDVVICSVAEGHATACSAAGALPRASGPSDASLGVLLSVGDPTAPSDDGPASVSGIHRLPPIDGRLPPIDGLEADGPGTRTILGPPPAGTGVPWATSRWPWLSRAGHLLLEDQRGFYACESVTGIAAAFGAGAIMANTGFDTTVQNAWQRSVTPSDLGHFFSGCKDIGEGRYALAVFGTAAATGVALDGLPVADVVGDWGERSLRIFVVGAAPLYVLQLATGASRPEESSAGSRWKFFQDANGVSGHAFVGAIPFLAAAGMVESPLAKGSLYVCSTFVGFSRVTDNDHYPSQIFLGWYLAFASAMAVNRTDLHFAGMEVEVVPIVLGDAQGLGLVATW